MFLNIDLERGGNEPTIKEMLEAFHNQPTIKLCKNDPRTDELDIKFYEDIWLDAIFWYEKFLKAAPEKELLRKQKLEEENEKAISDIERWEWEANK